MNEREGGPDAPGGGLLGTGIEGLDRVLHGGLAPRRAYLVEGQPGSGKTTLGLQFLLEGARRGEAAMYVGTSETAEEIAEVAESHGWDLGGVEIVEPVRRQREDGEVQYTMFHPSEVELGETVRAVFAAVERHRPRRVVIDSLSEFRLLTQDPLWYRRQILSIKHFLADRGTTVVLVDDRVAGRGGAPGDADARTLCHGVLELHQAAPVIGPERRQLRVAKMRGRTYLGGHHDARIVTGGLVVFPRLASTGRDVDTAPGPVRSGTAALDALLGGGLSPGTSTIVIGPAGSGKSTICAAFARHAAEQGGRAAIYTLEEPKAILRARMAGLGMELEPLLADGTLALEDADAVERSPGELFHRVLVAAERGGASVVVLDSLDSLRATMAEERHLEVLLRQLLVALGRRGVATLLTKGESAGASDELRSDISYVADTAIKLRYFEARGRVRQAISVSKKRTGPHERTIRELRLGPDGLWIGEPLSSFQGILYGSPRVLADEVDGNGAG